MKTETYYICDNCYSAFPGKILLTQSCPDCDHDEMMPVPGFEYETGDQVIIKSMKEMEESLPGNASFLDYDELDPGYDPDMQEFCGQVTSVKSSEPPTNWLCLECDKEEWCWSSLWVKPYESESTKELKSCLEDDLFEL